ncbi:MAG: hypothetical protein ABI876_04650 [Bacteroidota bacterium]
MRQLYRPSRIKPQSWNAVVERYAPIDHALPIARLAGAIAASPYADLLFPVTSMFEIRVYADPESPWDREYLNISFSQTKGMFYFEYVEHVSTKTRWTKECTIEESFSGFIHFLALKRWFPVREIPRGSWSCDCDIEPRT